MGTILYGLLNRTMDQLDAVTRDDLPETPFQHALAVADAVARVYTDDSDYLRPLWRFELGMFEPEHRPVLMNRALRFWSTRLQSLEHHKCLPRGIDLGALAREFQIFFAGVLDLWVQNELSDEQLRLQVRYGAAMRLLSLGVPAEHEGLMRDVRKTRRQLQVLESTAI
jgi:hypothetical protein